MPVDLLTLADTYLYQLHPLEIQPNTNLIDVACFLNRLEFAKQKLIVLSLVQNVLSG